MMYSAYKLNKQGDNIQPWHTPFPFWNQSVVPCTVLTVASWPAYRFLKRQFRCSRIPISFRIFHSLLWSTIFHGIVKEKQRNAYPFESEVAQSCPTLCNPWTVACTRLLHPWDFPGKNTRVGCHFLLQGVFPTQGSNLVSGIAGRRFTFQATREAAYPFNSTKMHILQASSPIMIHSNLKEQIQKKTCTESNSWEREGEEGGRQSERKGHTSALGVDKSIILLLFILSASSMGPDLEQDCKKTFQFVHSLCWGFGFVVVLRVGFVFFCWIFLVGHCRMGSP